MGGSSFFLRTRKKAPREACTYVATPENLELEKYTNYLVLKCQWEPSKASVGLKGKKLAPK